MPIKTHVMPHDDCSSPMTSAPVLHVQDLTCSYGDQVILDNLSLSLDKGEIFGITGAAGGGMSTLIKAILRLIAPQAGRILVFSKPHELSSSRAHLAYLPENLQTPGHLTGYDVANMAGTVQGKSQQSIEELAIDLDLPLKQLAHPTRSYAAEDIQKLGLAALLSMDRPILLLDQPMLHIGPKARVGLARRLRDHASKGGAVLLGSHVIDDHRDLADRIVTLKDGRFHPETALSSRTGHPGTLDEACCEADPVGSAQAIARPEMIAQRPSG